MIWYFLEDLKPSIRAQLNIKGRDVDSWEETVKKTINMEVKSMLQSSSSTFNMDSRCPQGIRPAKKKEKDSRMNKFTDSALADKSSRKQSYFT